MSAHTDAALVRDLLALGARLERLESAGAAPALRLAKVAAVNLNVTTKTTLYTVPTGRSCLVLYVVVRAASTSLTTASYGFGFDANATDVIAEATHTELTGNTLYTVLQAKAGSKIGAAADVFGVKCGTGQGGAATVTVEVYGRTF